jgi:hypothetical protein
LGTQEGDLKTMIECLRELYNAETNWDRKLKPGINGLMARVDLLICSKHRLQGRQQASCVELISWVPEDYHFTPCRDK